MTNKFRTLSLLFALACLLGTTSLTFAQGTNLGNIRGTVTDPNGAAVPGAQVQVTDLETNITSTLNTNDEGNYEAANLKFGRYRVSISGQGFKTAVVNEVVVRGSDTVRADAQLEVGGGAGRRGCHPDGDADHRGLHQQPATRRTTSREP
jgi:hypothetical protein